jgi:uncharacterized membrane protein (UPF0136 family)
MPPKHHSNFDVTFLTLLSILGLILVTVLTAYPPTANVAVPWRKPLIGSIFSIICILGALAVFSPNQCLKIFKLKNKNSSNSGLGAFVSHRLSPSLKGHHPSCGNFAAHVFQVRNKTFCAACTGLFIGALLALTGALIYSFNNWGVFEQNSYLMVSLGVLGVGLGLFQFKFRNFVRLSLNTFFVLGTLFVLVGIDERVQSLIFDLFVLSMILFWLFTRISLSQWDHKRICLECHVTDCELAA